MHNFRPLLVLIHKKYMIFGSRKEEYCIRGATNFHPFSSKFLEFGVARGHRPLAYRNVVFGELNTHLRIQDFLGGG